ncbi:heavy metal translocating P-type ATPase [Alicyclobacillus macrosporangiidus]|uniref:heavy metal translocating P-type ATPase n=1 Tax=Alicyclobacillus macrosporangiidus TaxID=392015 RepID=UPI000556E748|nr:heavy metal translocating P-type ATPase [Alicyclobacillus macrosporangiidus]MCL6454050.1 cadmium-translocating P-type ATPase [Alicyclobacillus sp.]
MTTEVQQLRKNKAVFRVEGITCLDCATKFEKNVAALPGVTRAVLNPTTGRLIVEGNADLDKIRQEGKKENYRIFPENERPVAGATVKQINGDLIRAILSGVSLVIGYASQKLGAPMELFLPFYIAAIVSGGWVNAKKAFYSIPRLDFNMSVLMTTAVIGAMAIGKWEEGATVAFLYSISELLEAWSMERARKSIRDLMDITPKMARIKRPTGDVEIPVDEVEVGDIMIIRPGEKIPMDGRILKGESAINEAAITGESVPAEKGPGAEVFAGTLNTTGSLEIEVTKRVEDTTIAKIIHLVEEAQTQRAPTQAFVDRFAKVYTPIVLALAVGITFVPPLLLGYHWGPWVYRGLALLVVSCPCALVVSTPVAIVSAISNAARNGVLVKGGIYLEQAGSLRAIVFDKTGTLTKGKPVVTDVIPFGSHSELDLLQTAVKLEARSEHPLARAIVRAGEEHSLDTTGVDGITALPGQGVQGAIDGDTVYIGNLRMFDELGLASEEVSARVSALQSEGKTVMVVGTKQDFFGLIGVADEIRELTSTVIADLKRLGIAHTIMLTGDNQATARAVASAIGIDDFRAELLPQDKVEALKVFLDKYGKVAMVGDGINDAPALATATIGIAMGGVGTDTAMETADITLMADDLSKLPFTIRLSRAALRIIRQNIWFSLVIKFLAILAVFPGWLTLWLAILADMGASVLVTLNGIRLLGVKANE